MFTSIQTSLARDINDIKTVVLWHEKLRNTLLSTPAKSSEKAIKSKSFDALKKSAPSKLAWQIFDHCAAVSRIYALFEKALCELIEYYLQVLPNIVVDYSNLNIRLRQQHRIGVGQVLMKWSDANPVFSALAEQDIAGGLVDGLRGMPSYTLQHEAFLLSPENFRARAIVRLFSDLGFENAFSFVNKSNEMADFIAERLANTETAESFLDGLVRIRNEAAHESPSNLVSASEIANYADFVILVIDILASLLLSSLLRLGVKVGKCQKLASVEHVFSNNIVGLRAIGNGKISVGDRFYAGKKGFTTCEIRSLRIVREEHSNIVICPGLEFGAQLDRRLPLGAEIIEWIH